MKNNYNSVKHSQRVFVGWLRLMVLLLTFGSLAQSGFAQTTSQIGTGVSSSYFYGPIYRSSAASSFDWSRYAYLYTAAELSAAGIPSGATIVGVEWFKNSTFTISNTGNASFSMYMKNSATAAYPASNTWASLISGATLVNTRIFNNSAAYPAIPGNFPAATGWMNFTVTPFVYNGTSLEIMTDFDISAVTNSPTNGAFNWLYATNVPNQALGVGSGTANPATLTQTSYGAPNRPNIRIIWQAGASTDLGLQLPALPLGATICNGASTTVSLTLRNNGSSTVDFSVDPATINCSVTGPNGTTFTPVTINSGTLAASTSQVVTIALGYDAQLSGTYNFSASLTWSPDGFAGNNTLNWSASSAASVVASSNVYTFCDGTIPQLTTAAASDYVVTSIAHAPITAVSPTAGPTGDDAILANVPIPFPFTFYGNVFSSLNISTNGYVELGTNSAVTIYGSTMPATATPNNVIAMAWEDLNASPGVIQYFTSGVAPNRKFVIEWNAVFFYVSTGNVTGQIVLNEADNSIDIFHTNITQAGNSAVCGIENAGGTAGVVAPGRQFGAWTPDPTTNQGWHFALPTISYAWTPATGLSNAAISNPTATVPSGTQQIYTVTATNSLSGCAISDTVKLTNLGAGDPAPTTTGTGVCAGAPATLSASGLSTLNWYTAAIGGTLVFTGTTWNNTWTSTTTYYVESFNGICPSARTPVTVTVTPQPVINPTAAPSVLCLGTTSQLTANNYVSGNLQTPVLGGNGSSGNAFDIANINGSSPIRIDSVYMGIASGTLAEVWYKPGGYGCATLSSSAGWTLAGSVAITPAGGTPLLTSIPLFVNVTIPVGQTYGFVVVCNGTNYYTNGSAVCTPLLSDANISVSQGHGGLGAGGAFNFPNAPRNFNGKIFYSFGDPNLTFNWQQTAGTGSISNPAIANPSVTPTFVGVNTYQLTAVNAANCSTTVAVNVTANDLPLPVSSINSSSSFCGCGVATLTAVLPTPGSDVRWYDAATGGNLLGTGTPFNAAYACGVQTYYAETFNTVGGCIQAGARVPYTFTPLTADVVTLSASDLNLCDGEPASLLTAGSVNPNYTYAFSPLTGLSNITATTADALPAVTTTYIVTGTDAGTGCINQASVTVGVGNTPIISGATATPGSICVGGSSQFNVSAYSAGGGGPAPVGYAASAATSTADDEIFNVTFGSLNNTSDCSTTGGGASALNLYSDYTALPAPTVISGQSVPFSVTVAYCNGTAYGMQFIIYIDWNRDGDFIDAGEAAYSSTAGTAAAVTGTAYPGSITVPSFASAGQTRMRVVLTEGSVAGPTGTYTWGETEDYTINVLSATGLTYLWSPALNLTNATISNPIANPSVTTPYTVVVSDPGGCTATNGFNLTVVNPPVPPTVNNDSRCGQGIVNLSASGSGGTIFWVDTIGGPILTTGNTYSPFITSTQTYYVYEDQGATTANVGLLSSAPGTLAFASSAANYQTFNVLSPNGIIINTVDIVPNAGTPLGTPISVQLEDNLGNPLGAPVSTVTTTQGTVQTISLNMFVPQGTAYRLRPVQNPNLQYHQSGFTNPYTIPGQVSITGWGPPNATTLYVAFYNWQVSVFSTSLNTGCYSAPSIITATVNSPPVLTITPSGPTSWCNSGSVDLTASGPGYVNFNWTPAAGLSSTTSASVTATPSVTTTYTVTADDGGGLSGCATTASVTVNVNSGPTVSIAPAPFDSLCSGASFVINATSGSSSFKTVGTGTNSANNTIAVYDGNNANVKTQILYTAAELNAAGLIGPGNITSISYNVVNKLSTTPLTGFTIQMANVATAPPLTATYGVGPFTTVFSGNVSTVLGWNQHVFSTAFAWDGVSNVLVSICNGTPGVPAFDQVQCTPTASAQTILANLLGCASATGAVNLNRPNTRFTGGQVNYSWSPSGELSAANIEDPTFTATADGAKTLTLTVTDPANGCQASAALSFMISGTPKAPAITTSSNPAICVSATVLVVASGTTGSYQWQSSSDNLNWSDISGETNDSLSILVSTDTYFRAKASCANDAFSNSVFFDVTSPAAPVAVGDAVCGQGTASLNANVDPGLFTVWYTAQTGGSFIQVGNPLDTFVTATTTFWAAASVAPVANPDPAPTNYPANSGTITADEDITAVTIGSLVNNQPAPNCALYTDYTGLTPHIAAPGDVVPFSISIGDCENSGFFSSGVAMFVDFNRNGDFADAGEQVYTTLATTNGLYTVSGTFTVPLTASIGFTRVRIINAEGVASPVYNQSYSYGETEDYLLQIGNTVCQSPRVPVIATVTTAPPVTIFPASATICEGDSVLLIDNLGSYPFYSWSPALTVIGPLGDAYAAPTVTTTYILTGNDGLCQNTDTVVITVNPKPVFTMSAVAPNLCSGDTAQLSVNVTSPVAGNYVVTAIPHAPLTPTGPVTVLADAGVAVAPQTISSLDDGTWDGLPLPAGFAFNYYGTTPTQFSVSTNGFITLSASTGGAFCCSGQSIPSALAPNDYIALAHEDWLLSTSGTIDYFTNGVAPFRKFVIRYTAVPRFGGTGAPTTGQIILNETLNTIEFHATSVTTAVGDFTTMGIEDGTGTQATVVSGRNFLDNWTATNEGWSFALPPAATISWTGQNIIGSTTGTNITAVPSTSSYYYATVTNPATGCVKTDSILITFAATPKPYIITNDTALCGGLPIDVVVQDTGQYAPGLGGYPLGTNFTWVNIAPATPDLDTISSNNGSSYQVIVTLANQCSATSNTRTILTKSVAVQNTVNSSSCTTPGSIEVVVSTGDAPFRYIWSDDLAQTNILRDVTKPENKDTLPNLGAGTYYLQVYDTTGSPFSCSSGVLTYVIGGTSAISASVATTDISCNGNADGSADVTWTGGSSPFSIVWSDGQAANTTPRNISAGGNYSVIVSDGSGCADTVNFAVVEPLPVSLSMSSTPSTGSNGTVTLVATGGTAPYTYDLYDGPGIILIGSGSPVTGLAVGLYTGVVTDANGCSDPNSVQVTVPVATNATFNIRAIIEGYYDGIGGMVPVLLNSGVGLSATECDTILVEVRDQTSPTTVLASGQALLDISGQATVSFPVGLIGQNVYLAIFHRNAVQTWSPLVSVNPVTNYDFTTAAAQSYGPNMIEVSPGIWAFYSGDVDQDEFVGIVDQGIVDNDVFNFVGGYVVTDITGNGFVDIIDQGLLDNNIFNFIGSVHP